MESNACARLRCRPIVRPRNDVVIGFAGGVVGVCCATRLNGRANIRIAVCEVFIGVVGMAGGGAVIVAAGPGFRDIAWKWTRAIAASVVLPATSDITAFVEHF